MEPGAWPGQECPAGSDGLECPGEAFPPKRIMGLIAGARRRSLARSALISLLVSAALIALLVTVNHLVLNAVSRRIGLGEEAAILYTCPNTYASGGLGERWWGLFGGQMRFRLYRMVGYTPIPVEDRVVGFGWFGVRGRYPAVGSSGPVLDSVEAGRPRVYDASALAPSLYFYHPLVPYDSLPDDLGRLSGAGAHTVAEVALSLDRLYGVSEILSLLPPGVDARWYAVNIWASGEEVPGSGVPSGPDGSDRVNLPITYGLVGFPAFPGLYCSQRDDGSAFLEALGCLARTRGPEQRLFRQADGYVREHGLQVFGVVVTGKASDLLQLRGRPWVRAAVLGLTANEF